MDKIHFIMDIIIIVLNATVFGIVLCLGYRAWKIIKYMEDVRGKIEDKKELVERMKNILRKNLGIK